MAADPSREQCSSWLLRKVPQGAPWKGDDTPCVMLLDVCIPDGLRAGDTFQCEAEGQVFDIAVPEGCGGGQILQVDLPVESTPSTEEVLQEQLTAVEIVVPEGCMPGMDFAVEWGGLSYNIAVPDGVWPGQPITIEAAPVKSAPPALQGALRVAVVLTLDRSCTRRSCRRLRRRQWRRGSSRP